MDSEGSKQDAAPGESAALCRVGLFARCAASLRASRRCGFLATYRHNAELRSRLEFGRSRGYWARLLVNEPLALVIPEDHFVVGDLLEVLGEERHFPPPPGESITNWGTANPDVQPRSACMISSPFCTVVRKCSPPATWSAIKR